jgi:hypothetical protein
VKPDYSGIVDPIPEVSEILPRLFQGRRPAHYWPDYDLVVSTEEHLARTPMDGYPGIVVHIALRDEDDFHLDRRAIGAAALAAYSVWQNGGRVLVHCSGGLNRSSLVTSEILILDGLSPREAVNLIRRSRDEYCLCNRAFERWVLRGQLPTADTSVFAAGTDEAS